MLQPDGRESPPQQQQQQQQQQACGRASSWIDKYFWMSPWRPMGYYYSTIGDGSDQGKNRTPDRIGAEGN